MQPLPIGDLIAVAPEPPLSKPPTHSALQADGGGAPPRSGLLPSARELCLRHGCWRSPAKLRSGFELATAYMKADPLDSACLIDEGEARLLPAAERHRGSERHRSHIRRAPRGGRILDLLPDKGSALM